MGQRQQGQRKEDIVKFWILVAFLHGFRGAGLVILTIAMLAYGRMGFVTVQYHDSNI